MSVSVTDVAVLDRMERAVEKVRERLVRATSALSDSGVPYAVVGGNAVAAWVATVDEAAVRNTRDVDVLLDRSDLDLAKRALEEVGFRYRHSAGIDLFVDGEGGKARDAIHVVFALEKVRPEYELPAPDATEVEFFPEGMRVLALSALVRMKLTSFRWRDRVHLLDLIEVGLVGDRDLKGLPPRLSARLRECLENPEA